MIRLHWRNDTFTRKTLYTRQAGIKLYLREHPDATLKQLAYEFDVSESTIKRDLRKMGILLKEIK